MNRMITKLFSLSLSSRILPRIYASTTTSTTAETGHHGSGEVHHHQDRSHDHHHHHEPELRKTHEWRHHSGIQSKYENQSEDPSLSFMQGKFDFVFRSNMRLIRRYNQVKIIIIWCENNQQWMLTIRKLKNVNITGIDVRQNSI